ncbi:uncharacterized protein LOC105701093 [Orussus abietinus]|uniref:uncharacterized protein LOC105701093 n=1 Tax=Orussus abietinus TaxID=222816 RepID=UPI000626D112|nr:uncharacterized protein LOC105701093 [Orussus abietinus]
MVGPTLWDGKRAPRPAQAVSLVVSAMKNLKETEGCTLGKIVGYISDAYKKRAPKRQVVTALKRGIEFGILKRRRGHYFLTSELEDRSGHRNLAEASRSRTVSKKKTVTRKHRRRSRVPKKIPKKSAKRRLTRSYSLSNMYYNPSYKAASSTGSAEVLKKVTNETE